jgi:hypothetical protein
VLVALGLDVCVLVALELAVGGMLVALGNAVDGTLVAPGIMNGCTLVVVGNTLAWLDRYILQPIKTSKTTRIAMTIQIIVTVRFMNKSLIRSTHSKCWMDGFIRPSSIYQCSFTVVPLQKYSQDKIYFKELIVMEPCRRS